MRRSEESPLLHTHSHSHGNNGHSHDNNDFQYMTVNVHDPSTPTPHAFQVLTPDCAHNHSNLSRSGSQRSVESQFRGTYQNDCELDDNEDQLVNLLQKKQLASEENDIQVAWIIKISLWINIVLFGFKVWAYLMSHSLSIAASTVDSLLDLCVQVVIHISHDEKRSKDDRERFPVGKSRYEPVGLIICSALMFIVGLQLISQSALSLWDGGAETVNIDMTSISVIILVIILKSGLWYYCYAQRNISDSVETLAFDHRNDVLSNLVALFAILLVQFSPSLWWCDPIGCIAISIYIANNWFEIAREKIHELVGITADESFVTKLTHFVNRYHPEQMQLDTIRAYHFGQKYLVEIDVVLPEDMPLRETHDITLKLQQKIERMEQVERCFVHCDYLKRDGLDEHDSNAVVESRLASLRQQTTQQLP